MAQSSFSTIGAQNMERIGIVTELETVRTMISRFSNFIDDRTYQLRNAVGTSPARHPWRLSSKSTSRGVLSRGVSLQLTDALENTLMSVYVSRYCRHSPSIRGCSISSSGISFGR